MSLFNFGSARKNFALSCSKFSYLSPRWVSSTSVEEAEQQTQRKARNSFAHSQIGFLLLTSLVLGGCHTDMWVQPKLRAQQESDFHVDRQASRGPLEGTVARGEAKLDDAFYTGRVDGKLVSEFPVPVTGELMKRGKERFEIFCSHCHGAVGDGKGMIAQRGLSLRRQPGNYHTERLRTMPIGHFYDVISNGYGVMFPMKDRIPPKDRWAIAAYIRALQLSQNARSGDLPSKEVVNFSEEKVH